MSGINQVDSALLVSHHYGSTREQRQGFIMPQTLRDAFFSFAYKLC